MARLIGMAIFTALMNATIAAAAETPHVVYILADDMGYGDVRAWREDCKFPTPHLDRLGE